MRIFLMILFAFYSFPNYAKERPKVFLDSLYTCDTAPYQLIFEDHFNGNSLDTSFWTTYLSWHSTYQVVDGKMVYGDHPNTCGARSSYQNAFYLDENVVVSDGTCKLIIKNEAKTLPCILGLHDEVEKCNEYNLLNCPDSTTKYYTVGGIFSKFRFANKPDGSPHTNHFSNGKFEARLRHPIADGTWSCMWTWYGTRVNEIDITESWGGKERTIFNQLLNAGGKRSTNLRRNIWAFHAWNYPNNPFGFPDEGQDEVTYDLFSGQNWTDVFSNKVFHKQEDWHVYTCEWDSNVVRIYIDGTLEKELWKYYKLQTVNDGKTSRKYQLKLPAECNADIGWYYLTEGFPYESNSMSQLRFNTSLTAENIGYPPKNIFIDQMEIDYVKIWQRHPEIDGRTVLKPSLKNDSKNHVNHSFILQDTPTIVIVGTEFENIGTQFYAKIADADSYEINWKYEVWHENKVVAKGIHHGNCLSTQLINNSLDSMKLKWNVIVSENGKVIHDLGGEYFSNHHPIRTLNEIDDHLRNETKVWNFMAWVDPTDYSSFLINTQKDLLNKYCYEGCTTSMKYNLIANSELNALFDYLIFEKTITYNK